MIRRRIIGLASFVLVVALWEIAAALHLYNPILLPPPSAALAALARLAADGTLAKDLTASLTRYGIGFAIGCTAGALVGLITSRVQIVADAVEPLFHYFRSIPSVALIPAVIVLFGIGDPGKVAIIVWACFFPTWLNTHLGIREVRVEHIRSARSLGAGPVLLATHVLLPSALPFMLAGVRLAIATGLFALAAGEMVGASAGIAFRIFQSYQLFHTDAMIANTLLIGVIALTADLIVVALTVRLAPWSRATKP